MTAPKISVVLPVYNQADHIVAVVEEYEEALVRSPFTHELILVVNGCRDRSLEVCRELAERYEAVQLVHSSRGGWGLGVRLGLSQARGELLCYTNSARTSAKELMLLLIYAVTFPDAVIKANRKIRESWRRRLGSLLYNLECRALFDLPYWDINGTPKVFPRKFERLLSLTRDDDLLDAEFHIRCREENYPMLEVPIFSTRRHGGKSTTGIRSGLRMYWRAYRLWRSQRENGG
jgi:glycosyltransferase involved in cell wall biosynthesis